ncbi:MAG: hypothetical protein M3N08_07725 [Pseudomonadota bacterium]|nr:hypothetical protein [Pseudomonadota bacterium]
MKKRLAAVGLLVAALALAPLSSASAHEEWHHHGFEGYHHGDGLVLGLAAAAAAIVTAPFYAVGAVASGPVYAAPAYPQPVYAQPYPPVYPVAAYAPAPGYPAYGYPAYYPQRVVYGYPAYGYGRGYYRHY